MGNNNENEYTLNRIVEYNGNNEDFKKLNEKLDKPFNYQAIYEDKEKIKIKYKGQIKKMNLKEEEYYTEMIIFTMDILQN